MSSITPSAENGAISFTVEDGIGWLAIDLPGEKVNKLSSVVMAALGKVLEDLQHRNDLEGVVIRSGKEGMFIAGADLQEIRAIAKRDDALRFGIGLPEVNLGIIPAWGGTSRLPRLVGLREALELILTGRTIDARKAARIGLLDRAVPHIELEKQAVELVRRVRRQGRFRKKRGGPAAGLPGWRR